MSSTSLRDQLGVPADPEFEIELPPGWSRQPVEKAVFERLAEGLKQRLMKAHKPQVYAELKMMLDQSFDHMRRNGAFAFFTATEQDPATLAIPASIIASTRKAAPGGNLDDLAKDVIRNQGATPLLGDKRFLRFEQEQTVRIGTDTVINHSIIYITPIPGSKRRRALQLVAGFGRTPDTPTDHPSMEAQRLLFDACVSTLRWRTPGGRVIGGTRP